MRGGSSCVLLPSSTPLPSLPFFSFQLLPLTVLSFPLFFFVTGRRLTAIRTVQLATPPLPPKPIAKAKPKKERKSSQGAASAVKMAVDPGSASAPVPPVVKLSSTAKPPSTGAAAPVASSGGGTKIKLNFGGANAAAAAAAKEKARKNSLTVSRSIAVSSLP